MYLFPVPDITNYGMLQSALRYRILLKKKQIDIEFAIDLEDLEKEILYLCRAGMEAGEWL